LAKGRYRETRSASVLSRHRPVSAPSPAEPGHGHETLSGSAEGEFFFQKHSPKSKPDWIPVCEILHPSANAVDFPVVQNLAGLLRVVNLGASIWIRGTPAGMTSTARITGR
jgi:hypothetical protein